MSSQRVLPHGAGLGKTRLVLAFTAMLPVFVMLGWFLSYRDDARRRELEDARQILGMAVDRVEASIAPTAPLESILSEELSNRAANDLNTFEATVRKAFEQVIPASRDPRILRINLFKHTAEPVSWPPDENPQTGAAIWKGLSEIFRRNITEEAVSVDSAAMASGSAALSEWFDSKVSLNDLMNASYFDLVTQGKQNRPTAVAVFRTWLDRMRTNYLLGAMIRVPLEAIPPASYHAWAVISRPSDEDAAGLGILDPSGRRWLARSGRLPDCPLQVLLAQPNRVAAVPGGFAILRDLPPHAPGKLVLFRPESFWTGGGAGFRLAMIMLVAVAAAFSWLLAGFLSGLGFGVPERAAASGPQPAPHIVWMGSLRTRTAIVFLLAGMVPIGFSALQGAMRLLDLEAVRRVEWQIEAQRAMISLDRGFRDTLERYQEIFSGVARDIAGKPGTDISDISAKLASCTEMINIEVARPVAGKRQEVVTRSTEGRRIIMSPVLHKIVKDLFLEMRAAAGYPRISEGASGKETLALPIHELIGDAVPLRELFNKIGHITYLILGDKTALLFCRTYGMRGERISGMLVGGTTLGNDSSSYFDENTGPGRWKYPEWELFRINKTVIDPKLPSIPREFLRLAVRTEQTGSAVGGRVDFYNDSYNVLTSRPSYLHLGVLAARIPVGHLKKETAWMFALACAGVLIALGMAVGVAVYLSKRLLEPIRMLQKAAESVGDGVLDISLPVHGKDELAQLGASFLEMTDGLRQRERMRRFLSESAWVGTESEGDSGEEKSGYIYAAILCSDIRNFTGISERQAPADVTAMLNDYFTAMDGVIRTFGGEIDKLIGDAVQAVFKTGTGLEHPAKRAVRAGLAMRRKLSEINAARSLRGEFTVENGIGIFFGKMISGKVGAAGGRQDFTVIGPGIAVAAKLEAASRQGRHTKVIVSAETAGIIGQEFSCEPLAGGGDDCRQAFEVISDRIGEKPL